MLAFIIGEFVLCAAGDFINAWAAAGALEDLRNGLMRRKDGEYIPFENLPAQRLQVSWRLNIQFWLLPTRWNYR